MIIKQGSRALKLKLRLSSKYYAPCWILWWRSRTRQEPFLGFVKPSYSHTKRMKCHTLTHLIKQISMMISMRIYSLFWVYWESFILVITILSTCMESLNLSIKEWEMPTASNKQTPVKPNNNLISNLASASSPTSSTVNECKTSSKQLSTLEIINWSKKSLFSYLMKMKKKVANLWFKTLLLVLLAIRISHSSRKMAIRTRWCPSQNSLKQSLASCRVKVVAKEVRLK